MAGSPDRRPRDRSPDRHPWAWLDRTVFEAVPGLLRAEPPPSVAAGARLGPYEVIRQLGRGGMGSVVLARRADDQYRQQVAIKLVRSDLLSDGAERRFRQERQILADLEHPSIARMLGGDVTADGTPYLVMEYVEGEPIDAYCDRLGLSIDARLRIVGKVCAAVEHAHRQLVVHCDLKASNVLVTQDGEPKLLDFGIARLLAADVVPAPGATTDSERWRMTPESASPEQARGERLTAATDVYALGVMLYRLLTGLPPYRFTERTPEAIRRVICERPVAPPSTVAGSGSRRRLAGDLDAIVRQALHKDPAHRYGSVDLLAEDLRRHRAHLPVRARRGTVLYRTGKLVRRRLLVVASTALVVLSLTLGMWLADRQRARAETERGRAEAVAGFLEGLFLDADSAKAFSSGTLLAAPAALQARRLLLDEGARRVREELANQPAVQARLMQRIGDAYRNLGNLDRAEDLLRHAHGLVRRNHGARSPQAASSLESLCLVDLSQGELERAETQCRQALAIRSAAARPNRVERATSLNVLALVLREQGRLDEAERLLREALEIRRATLPAHHVDITSSLNNLSVVLQDLDRAGEAEPLVRQVLARKLERHGPRHLQVVNASNNLASVLQDLGEVTEAEARYRGALEAGRGMAAPHPLVATAHLNLGTLLARTGRVDEAVAHLETALAMDRDALGEDHPDVARDLQTLAVARYRQGDASTATEHLAQALDLHRRAARQDQPAFRKALFDLVTIHRAQGDDDAARRLLDAALAVWSRHPPRDDWAASQAEALLGRIQLRAGRLDAAEPHLRRASENLLAIDPGAALRRTRTALACFVELLETRGDAPAAALYRLALPAVAPPCAE